MVTIKEVAKKAGVSVATVSRVFNASGPVGAETARRVREVAAELHYHPHGGARSLITSKTHCLGVLLPDLYGDFFSELIRGLDQRAQQGGFHLLLSSAHHGKREVEAAMRAMRGRVDALVAMSPHLDEEALIANLPPSLPVSLVSSRLQHERYDSLVIDNARGAGAMVAHLIGQGHRRVAIIRGAAGNYDAEERLRGYRAALAAAGIGGDPALELAGDFTEASGFQAARELVALADPPTAIFAANDAMAIGALSALRELGRRVPEDVAVGGFDDIPLARYLNPALSSVHVPIAEMGARAADLALEALQAKADGGNGRVGRRETLPTQLVIRASTAGEGDAARATAPVDSTSTPR
jgi:LacI family transcriptional regulator